ncbi:MAG: hypothetical protein ACHREM_14675, partial [Polyangiales bacterium]
AIISGIDDLVGGRYYVSHGFYRFRWLPEGFEDLLGQSIAEPDLSKLVSAPTLVELGPYEKVILGWLLQAQGKQVLLVGNAGAGKTSAITTTIKIYERHVKFSDVDQMRRTLAPPWRIENHPCSIYIDFNRLWPEIENARLAGKTESDQRELALSLWADLMWNELLRLVERLGLSSGNAPVQTNRALLDIFEVSFRWANGAAPLPRGAGFRSVLSAHTGLIERLRAGSVDDNVASLLERLHALSAGDRIRVVAAVIEAIAFLANGTTRGFFAVCDNTDPMDAHIQRAIQNELTAVSHRLSLVWVSPVRDVNFRVRAFAGGFSWYPHCGPSPIDLVVLRCLQFIAAPEVFPGYKTLSEHQRAVAMARVFELALRIRRGRGAYQTLGHALQACCGDSVRRAYAIAHSLLNDTSIQRHPTNNATFRRIQALKQAQLEYEVRVLYERLGSAVGDVFLAAAAGPLLPSVDEAALSEVGASLGGQIRAAVNACLKNAISAGSDGLRGAAGPWRLHRAEQVCIAVLRDAVGRANRIAQSRRLKDSHRELVLGSVVRTISEAPLGTDVTLLPPGVAEHVSSIILDALKRQDSTSAETSTEEDPHDTTDVDEWQNSEWCRWLLSVNRPHIHASAFLASNHVANLLQSRGKVSDVRLHVMSFCLAAGSVPPTLGSLILELRSRGWGNDEILDTVNYLVNEDRRLIFIGREFSYDRFSDLEVRAQEPVTATRVGLGYGSILLSDIDYLIACVRGAGEPARVELDPVVGAVDRVVDVLSQLAERELEWVRTQKISSARLIEFGQAETIRSVPALSTAVRASRSAAGMLLRRGRRLMSDSRSSQHVRLTSQRDATACLTRWAAMLRSGFTAFDQLGRGDYRSFSTVSPLVLAYSIDPRRESARVAGDTTSGAEATSLVERAIAALASHPAPT